MQPGAKGATLEMTDTPDVVVVDTPEVCSGWVGDLADAELMGGGAPAGGRPARGSPHADRAPIRAATLRVLRHDDRRGVPGVGACTGEL